MPIFQFLRTNFEQNFRFLVHGGSKLTLKTFYSKNPKFQPIFEWGIRKNWSPDDLPTPQLPGPEDFADFLS
jgi:hypothetical protein